MVIELQQKSILRRNCDSQKWDRWNPTAKIVAGSGAQCVCEWFLREVKKKGRRAVSVSARWWVSRHASWHAACPQSELRKFSGESYSGRYPTSGSRSFVAKYFLVGVRIRNEYPHVAAVSCLLLRVLKTRPGVGIAFRDTPATPSTPPDPAHNRQSALRIGSHTPPQAPSTTPPSHGAVALGP